MKINATLSLAGVTLILAMIGRSASACGGYLDIILRDLAQKAVSEDPAAAHAASVDMREFGSAALSMFEFVHREDLAAYREHLRSDASVIEAPTAADDARWARLRAAIDTIGAQRDNFAAPLYWYTDLEQAKRVAAVQNRPILSLRLLGRLDEEYSCANSRFFRTALYANNEVARTLRDRFVLHWQTVRPVPRITIDFGAGRRLERTITGNSTHLVLDAKGRPVDVIPGLYGPAAFIAALDDAARLTDDTAQLDGSARDTHLRSRHWQLAAETRQAWSRDLEMIGRGLPANSGLNSQRLAASPAQPAVLPDAGRAMPIAVTKRMVQMPMLRVILPDASALESVSDDEAWTRIAALHADRVRLDDGSRLVMAKKTEGTVAVPLAAKITRFEKALALDTVRNEYLLHRMIHEWFVNGTASTDADVLTARVYDELFLTPDADPWLGLAPANVYTALDGEGLVQN